MLYLNVFLINGNDITSNEVTAYGDSLAMAIDAAGVTPLTMITIELATIKCDMVAFADFFRSAQYLKPVFQWSTVEVELKFINFPETKSCGSSKSHHMHLENNF